jgi:hypothetical protein
MGLFQSGMRPGEVDEIYPFLSWVTMNLHDGMQVIE